MARQRKHRDPLIRKAAELWETHTDPQTGEIDTVAALQALTAWIKEHEEVRNDEAVARRTYESLDRELRPKARQAQLTMFEPRAVLPLGEGGRVWMEDCSPEQFSQWSAITTETFAQQAAAAATTASYQASRIRRWGARAKLRLVEEEVFNWTEPMDDDDDDDEEEEDDV